MCYMKRCLFLFLCIAGCVSMTAQPKMDFLKFIENLDPSISSGEFSRKYDDIFEYDKESGTFETDALTLAGCDARCVVRCDMSGFMSTNYHYSLWAVLENKTNNRQKYLNVKDNLPVQLVSMFGEPRVGTAFKSDSVSVEDNLRFLCMELHCDENVDSLKYFIWDTQECYVELILSDSHRCIDLSIRSRFVFREPRHSIQRKFFNQLELGKPVTKADIISVLEVSEDAVLEEITSYGKQYYINKDRYFGGVEWDHIRVETINGNLAVVEFHLPSEKDNKTVYDDLLSRLIMKYGYEHLRGGQVVWKGIDGENITELSLQHRYAQSRDGNKRYYVILTYSDVWQMINGSSMEFDEL